MKITIDTSQDSHSEIKKAIRLLQSIVGDSHSVYTNAPSRNIFDDPSPTVNQQSEPEPSPSPTSAFANLFDSAPSEPEKEEEEKKDIPQVQLY